MCYKIISPFSVLNDEYVFEYAKWIVLIFLISMSRKKEGFKALIWVNKLIDGLIDSQNKSPIISLTRDSLSGDISCPN